MRKSKHIVLIGMCGGKGGGCLSFELIEIYVENTKNKTTLTILYYDNPCVFKSFNADICISNTDISINKCIYLYFTITEISN